MIIPDHCWVLTGIFTFIAGCLEREISCVLGRTEIQGRQKDVFRLTVLCKDFQDHKMQKWSLN